MQQRQHEREIDPYFWPIEASCERAHKEQDVFFAVAQRGQFDDVLVEPREQVSAEMA